jgi:hypothetical protein
MKVDVITPSGERPETLALCREYVARQTYPDINHIVVETKGTLAANLALLVEQLTGGSSIASNAFRDSRWLVSCTHDTTTFHCVSIEICQRPVDPVCATLHFASICFPISRCLTRRVMLVLTDDFGEM